MDSDLKKINSALVSVFNKDGLEEIVKSLDNSGVSIYATGGSRSFIEELGISVIPVESLTNYPSILGGRVKTLHPKVFGGILGRRSNNDDIEQLEKYEIPSFDLIVVDLYPFEETVQNSGTNAEIIEKIDIGGVSLIRAAAKNFDDVLVVPSKIDYEFLNNVIQNGCESSFGQRKDQARKAFSVTAEYDKAIENWFSGKTSKTLRYGENPHQNGKFLGEIDAVFTQLHGKELSYNNLLDIDAALNLTDDFSNPVTAILKHNNACGIASGSNPLQNWHQALESDPVSAFGGVIATNTPVDKAIAAEMNKLFFEVLIAPSYSEDALADLKSKKNRIILIRKEGTFKNVQVRTILNGILWQEKDLTKEEKSNLNFVTTQQPTEFQIKDLLFANTVVKHARSNAIVLVKDGRLLAAGVGQTSRIDALNQAIDKANSFNLSLENAVMASDAFFPFPDCVEIAHKAGIKAIIQPGGSRRDQESIDFCNNHELAMVFTGIRHFRH